MRIARIEAIAYGAIGGRIVEPHSGLTVIHGPNESGKSSTMQLIRGVLFGFPPLRGEGPRREPKGGGARSGRVDIVDEDGRLFRVERVAGSAVVITDAYGEPVGDAALMRALGITSVDLFDRVQTFDSRDLASMGLLDDPSVRAGVLASAVLGGGAGAAPVLDALRRRSEGLYKRQGENQPYAHALKAAVAARRALRDAESAAGAADRSADALAEAELRVVTAHDQRVAATREQQRLERLIELRTCLDELAAVDAQPPVAPPGDQPDAETISRFRTLVGELPVAVEARRRAAQHRADAGGEHEQSARLRERLVIAADTRIPGFEGEAGLRAAADVAREAEREAKRLADALRAAQELATAQGAPATSPARRGLGALVLALGVIGITAGWLLDLALLLLAGLLVVVVGAALLGGVIAAVRPRPADASPLLEPQTAAAQRAAVVADEARAAWRSALAAAGVGADLRADQLDDILGVLAAIRVAEQAADRARALAQVDDAAADELIARAVEALEDVGESPPAELEALRLAVDRTLHRLEAAREAAAAHRADVQAWQHRRDLAQARRDEIAHGDDALIAAAIELDLEQAQAQRTVLAGEVAVAAEQHTEAVAALGGTRALIASAEDSADVATAAQAAADAEADLRAIADQWLTLRLAHDVVERARDRFVEEHQPGVFERASAQIATATGGAWVSVRMPDGEKAGARSEVLSRDGSRTPFSELSEGTVGLVYLCLRTGLVDEMRDDGGPELPVLMDDVLTHLDPERRAGAAAVIADLASRHQVLYFTCHPEQVQALREAAPDLTEIALERLV